MDQKLLIGNTLMCALANWEFRELDILCSATGLLWCWEASVVRTCGLSDIVHRKQIFWFNVANSALFSQNTGNLNELPFVENPQHQKCSSTLPNLEVRDHDKLPQTVEICSRNMMASHSANVTFTAHQNLEQVSAHLLPGLIAGTFEDDSSSAEDLNRETASGTPA